MYDLKLRLVKLDKRQVDIIKELAEQGIKVAPAELSGFIAGYRTGAKADLVLAEADRIVRRWEDEI